MTGAYLYTSAIWLPLTAAVLLVILSLHSWRHRDMPAALPLAVGSLSGALWMAGVTLETVAVVPDIKIAWHRFQAPWQLATATAMTCFALEYAYPGRWLTRRNLTLLALPVLLNLLTIVIDGSRFAWRQIEIAPDGSIVRYFAVPGVILAVYGLSLGLVNVAVFLWLFIRSPQHRWPAGLMLFGDIVSRGLYGLYALIPDSLPGLTLLDTFVAANGVDWSMYAIALFGFRIFDPLPAARATAIRQMREGMAVFDARWRVASLNPAAASTLSISAAHARGRTLAELMPAFPDLGARLTEGTAGPVEITLGTGPKARLYALDLSVLKDFRGLTIGHLLLLHDVTEQRRAQAQILEQQRVLATLRERERLGRELHDSAGQILAYVSMQTQAIARRVRDGDMAAAEAQLRRLAQAAQEAHADIRESILSLKAEPAGEWSFLAALKHYLAGYSDHSGIATELVIQPGLGETAFRTDAGIQLLRVIQEALTNAHKHSGTRRVWVSLARDEGEGVIVVEDDGAGFDPRQQAAGGRSGHYGLDFMAERMAEVGGRLAIESAPGTGTRVELRAPLRDALIQDDLDIRGRHESAAGG